MFIMTRRVSATQERRQQHTYKYVRILRRPVIANPMLKYQLAVLTNATFIERVSNDC